MPLDRQRKIEEKKKLIGTRKKVKRKISSNANTEDISESDRENGKKSRQDKSNMKKTMVFAEMFGNGEKGKDEE